MPLRGAIRRCLMALLSPWLIQAISDVPTCFRWSGQGPDSPRRLVKSCSLRSCIPLFQPSPRIPNPRAGFGPLIGRGSAECASPQEEHLCGTPHRTPDARLGDTAGTHARNGHSGTFSTPRARARDPEIAPEPRKRGDLTRRRGPVGSGRCKG